MPLRTHTIKKGETLSKIAEAYGFQNNWEPIWKYNTIVRVPPNPFTDSSLKNPNLIYAGAMIYIPKTLEEYSKSIEHWKNLINQTIQETYQDKRAILDDIRDVKLISTGIDLGAAVAKSSLTVGHSLVHYGVRMRKLTATKESLSLLKKATDSLFDFLEIDKGDGLLIQSETESIVENGAHIFAGQLTKQRFSSSVGTNLVKNIAKDRLKVTVETFAPVEKRLAMAQSAEVVFDFACTFFSKGSGLLDAIVSSIDPSTIAKQLILYTTGDSIDDIQAGAVKVIEDAGKSTVEKFTLILGALEKEKKDIYES